MAETTLGSRLYAPLRLDSAVDWIVAHRELVAVGALMLLAAVLRFWDLGAMALHHDESLHARYTWLLYDGQGYQHNPLMHGPFLFHSGALVYFLFGDTDATSRFLPALFGSVLVGMPYLLRRQIGMPAVIIAAVLLTFSPTLLYFSRFYRNDIYLAVWSLAIVICIWRYLDEGKERYLYVMAAVLAFSFASKEVTFIMVAILLVFLDLMMAVEFGKRRQGEAVSDTRVVLRTLAYAPVAWIMASLVPVFPGRILGYTRLPPVGDVLMLLGLLSLPQFAAAVQVLPFVTNHGYAADEEATLRVVTVFALLLIAAYGGLLWRPKLFFVAAACFFVPYVLLYTTFFTNQPMPWTGEFWDGEGGFFSGIWGSLDYWLDQHHVKRGNQPGYYYALLTPLYEFLPMLLALGGAAWLLLRGDSLRRWLVFWLAATFLGLTLAGEKMPWLETHIALPMALAGALALAKAIDVLELTGRRWFTAAAAAASTAVAVILLVEGGGGLRVAGGLAFAAIGAWLAVCLAQEAPRGFSRSLARALAATELHLTVVAGASLAVLLALLAAAGIGVDQYAAVWAAATLPVVLIGYVIAHLMTSSKSFGRGLLVVAVAALMTLTVRAGFNAAFTNRDTPVEMLVYTQTSPDVPAIRDRIDALARGSGLGYNLPIVVDNADSFAWPWAWYLRDYHEVAFIDIDSDYAPPPNAVLLINRSNTGLIDESLYASAPYKHRWWFNETYRDLSFEEATEQVTDWARLRALGDFFLHRRSAVNNTGSVDAVAYFPLTLSAFDTAPGPAADPRPPVTLADGRVVIGTGSGAPGNAPGEFRQPAGLALDVAGNLWVADGGNNRVQRFDSAGNFLAQIGSAGAAPGGLNEPWSVAVDAGGFVYVADTWHHRIQKFAPDLSLVTTWGAPGTSADDPLILFGPRDIAVAPDGTLWVTDTGNNRLLHFDADGGPLDVIHGPGADAQFQEPVSVTVLPDGGLLVADAWSGRILRFGPGPEHAFTAEIAARWTSQDILDKPYVTVLTDGRILASHPETGRLLLLTQAGDVVGTWQPLQDSVPVGVVALPDGGFAFSDAGMHMVQIVPGAVVDGLFSND